MRGARCVVCGARRGRGRGPRPGPRKSPGRAHVQRGHERGAVGMWVFIIDPTSYVAGRSRCRAWNAWRVCVCSTLKDLDRCRGKCYSVAVRGGRTLDRKENRRTNGSGLRSWHGVGGTGKIRARRMPCTSVTPTKRAVARTTTSLTPPQTECSRITPCPLPFLHSGSTLLARIGVIRLLI